MKMPEPIKNLLNRKLLHKLALDIQSHYSPFQVCDFLEYIMDGTWNDLELKDRTYKITAGLGKYLPAYYPTAIGIIDKVVMNYGDWLTGGAYERDLPAPKYELNSMDRWADDYTGVDAKEKAPNMIPAFATQKSKYPNFKLLVSVGGWTRGDGFSEMVHNEANRKIFVNSFVAFMTKYKQFDGIDLDWEYPAFDRLPDFDDPNDLGSPASPTGDFMNYALLCNELRAALNTMPEGRRLLTACLPMDPVKIAKQDIQNIANACDFMNVMTYDAHGAFDPTVGYNSPLYPHPETPNEWSTSNSVDLFLKPVAEGGYGLSPSKINIGTPFYSRGWAGVKSDDYGNPMGLQDPTPIFKTNSIDITITADKSGTVNTGMPVTYTAEAFGGTGDFTYKFEVMSGENVISTRDFEASNQYVFTPTAAGTYTVKVTAEDSDNESNSANSAILTVVKPLGVEISELAPGRVNQPLTINVTPGGGTAPYQLSYYIVKDGGVPAFVGYTTSTQFTFTPTVAGSYQFRVYVTDANGKRMVDTVPITILN